MQHPEINKWTIDVQDPPSFPIKKKKKEFGIAYPKNKEESVAQEDEIIWLVVLAHTHRKVKKIKKIKNL